MLRLRVHKPLWPGAPPMSRFVERYASAILNLFLPEIYGLENHIPFHQIRRCAEIKRWYGNSLRGDFSRTNSADGALSPRLRKQPEFLKVLDTLLAWPSTQRLGGV